MPQTRIVGQVPRRRSHLATAMEQLQPMFQHLRDRPEIEARIGAQEAQTKLATAQAEEAEQLIDLRAQEADREYAREIIEHFRNMPTEDVSAILQDSPELVDALDRGGHGHWVDFTEEEGVKYRGPIETESFVHDGFHTVVGPGGKLWSIELEKGVQYRDHYDPITGDYTLIPDQEGYDPIVFNVHDPRFQQVDWQETQEEDGTRVLRMFGIDKNNNRVEIGEPMTVGFELTKDQVQQLFEMELLQGQVIKEELRRTRMQNQMLEFEFDDMQTRMKFNYNSDTDRWEPRLERRNTETGEWEPTSIEEAGLTGRDLETYLELEGMKTDNEMGELQKQQWRNEMEQNYALSWARDAEGNIYPSQLYQITPEGEKVPVDFGALLDEGDVNALIAWMKMEQVDMETRGNIGLWANELFSPLVTEKEGRKGPAWGAAIESLTNIIMEHADAHGVEITEDQARAQAIVDEAMKFIGHSKFYSAEDADKIIQYIMANVPTTRGLELIEDAMYKRYPERAEIFFPREPETLSEREQEIQQLPDQITESAYNDLPDHLKKHYGELQLRGPRETSVRHKIDPSDEDVEEEEEEEVEEPTADLAPEISVEEHEQLAKENPELAKRYNLVWGVDNDGNERFFYRLDD